MKIKFVKDAYYRGKHIAKKGDILDFERKDLAVRWFKRGHEIVEESPKENQDKKEEKTIEDMKKKELLSFAKDNEIEIPEEIKKVEEIKDFLKGYKEELESAF